MTDKPTKIILHSPLTHPALLNDFVETWLVDGVKLIAVIGPGCEDVHDLIDDILVWVNSEGTMFITTTWHDGEALSEVIEFVGTFGDADAPIKQVRL